MLNKLKTCHCTRETLNKISASDREIPSIRKILSREVSPETTLISRFVTPNISARKLTSSAFARPPAGTACTFIFSALPKTPTICVFFAFGTTRTRTRNDLAEAGSDIGIEINALRGGRRPRPLPPVQAAREPRRR